MIDAADTIAAIATAPGAAGVGVVRLSGPRAVAIVARLTGRAPSAFADRRMTLAVVHGEGGERLDEALCVVMRAPRSFTGEDVAELHAHGGALNLGRVLRAVVEAGARVAAPGEFSRRALRAGRLDAVRAEALLAVVEAASERALRVAQAQLAGGLGAAVETLARETREALAALEAAIDFPEEGLAELDRPALAATLSGAATRAATLAATHAVGRALREGVAVALRGGVNAGKSSLFNALLGRERALVAAEPGTTRDYVEATAVWDGVRVTLIDTAGDRPTTDETERRGIELGARRAAEADVEVWLTPAGVAAPADDGGAAAGAPGRPHRLVVVSKDDDGVAAAALTTSARTGRGIAALRRAVIAAAAPAVADDDDGVIVTTERQRAGLASAAAALERATATLAGGLPEDVVALEVREASAALAAVLGVGEDDAVLDALFARFCIGK